MTRRWGSYSKRPAAFVSIETLDEHLYSVALTAYTLLAARSKELALAAALAGMLHDIGKAVEPYQECLGYPRCTYVGHEVLSEYIAAGVLEELDAPLDKAVVARAVRLHHQYFGVPHERFHKLLRLLRRRGKGKESIYSRESIRNIATAARHVEQRLEECSEGFEDACDVLRNAVNAVRSEELVERALRMCVERRGAATQLTQQVYRGDIDVLLRARIVTGALITADKHVASLARSGNSPFHDAIEAYAEMLKRRLATVNAQHGV